MLPVIPFLVLMFVAMAIMSMGFHSPGIFAPVAAPELGVSANAIGPYTAVSSLASGVGGLLLSGLVRRAGGVRTLQVALSGIAAALLVAATAVPVLVAFSAFVLGALAGLVPVSTVHLMSRVAPARRAGLVFAINQCGVPAGAALGGLLVPFMIGRIDWRATAVVLAGVVFAGVLLLQTVRATVDTDRDPAARITGAVMLEPLRLVWSTPALRSISVVALCFMAMQVVALSYTVSYLNVELGTSLAVAGAAFAAAQLGSIVTRLSLGLLVDRIGNHLRVLAVMGILGAALSIVLALATPAWPIWALATVTGAQGMFSMGWTALYFAIVARSAPEGMQGRAMAGSQIFQMAGALGGPVLFAAIAATPLGMAGGFAVIAAAPLAAAVWLLARRAPRR